MSWEPKRLEKRFKDIVMAEIASPVLMEYLMADACSTAISPRSNKPSSKKRHT